MLGALLTVLGLLIAGIGLASPAQAQVICYYGNNDTAIDQDTRCRNFVVGLAPGQRLSRADLLAHAGDYERFGFTPNFLWYSVEGQTTISDPGMTWTACGGAYQVTPIGQFCDHSLAWGSLLGNWSQAPVTLSTFSFDGTLIFRACGNWGPAGPVLRQGSPAFASPVPHVRATKFHDLDRDGVRDPGEGPLAAVPFRLVRESSQVGQPAQVVATAQSDGSGVVDFALDGQGPGRYYVEEEVPSGWTRTTPDRRHVDVGFGIGAATLDAGDFGDVENTTDVAKVSFDLTDAPDHLEARTPTPITVTSVIANHGPAGPISVREQLTVTGPGDCTIDPPTRALDVTLARDAQRTVAAVVTITCDRTSFHPFTFTNNLTVTTPGVQDVAPANNTAVIEHTWPVLADADLTPHDVALDCPDQTQVGTTFDCTATGDVVNNGPYGPVDAHLVFDLTGPDDCTLTPTGDLDITVRGVESGASARRTAHWNVSCSHRSYHPFTAGLRVTPIDQHVRDVPGNDTADADDTVQVFEPADLHVDAVRPLCTEVGSPGSFGCTADVVVGNAGPGTAVQTRVTADLVGSTDCTVAPAREQIQALTLNAGQNATRHFAWQVTCPGTARAHTFTITGRITADEPHIIDAAANDSVSVVWSPVDVKPNSDPNTINVGRNGVISVAVLRTPTFNPFTDLDTTTLRFGPTGSEAPVVRCATQPEDVNSDGLADMTCKFDNTATGFHVGDQYGYLTGQTTTGVPYLGADAVRVIP